MARRFRKIGLLGKLGIRKVNVPSLSGLTRAQAKQELESKGLTWQETAESTANISLDLNIKEQSVASGSTVKIGDTIGFTYYGYVAPPNFNPGFAPVPDPPQDSSISSSTWNGTTVIMSGSFPTQPTNISVDGTNIPVGSWSWSTIALSFLLSGEGSRSIQVYNGKTPLIPGFTVSYNPSPGFNPGFNPGFDANPGFNPGFDANPGFNPGFSPGFDVGPGFDITLTSLDLSALFDFGGGKSIGIATLVRTTDGLVKAGDLQVGDTLLSANIEGFPYEHEEGVTQAALDWSDSNPSIIPEITNIVALYKTQSAYAVVINQDVFSQYHYILIKRDGIAKFEVSVNISSETDLIYSYENNDWEPIYLYEIVAAPHDIVSINCEPFDMFYTERMLTHDSSAI
jgi:hypothetical protein